jgi:hypothetical protein
MQQQLDLFTKEGIEILSNKVEKTTTMSENVRRGLFARHNRIEKLFYELQDKLEEQQKEVCRLKEIVLGTGQQPIYELKEVCL